MIKSSKNNLESNKTDINNNSHKSETIKNKGYKLEYVWVRVILMVLIHVMFLYDMYIIITVPMRYKFTIILYWNIVGILSSIGITAGAHRLWTHRTYKATLPLRIILMLLQTMAHQNTILEWARDHRAHHKFTDTDADPHNSRRGFFFSHIGWLLVKKHPEIKRKGITIDMSDVASDPVVQFQEKYFYVLMPLICFYLPTLIPYYLLESTAKEVFFASIARYVITLNLTWSINSIAHIWGYKPYDKTINPSDHWIPILLTIGEGFHNYHHVFPWDYKCSEFGSIFNSTKTLLDLFGKIGWAYDMKTVSEDVIRKRILRTGDGTREINLQSKKFIDLIVDLKHENETEMLWGWDDKDMKSEDLENAIIVNEM